MKKTSGQSSVVGSLMSPCSKSYAQRAIAAALLTQGQSQLHNMELCNDTRAALGVAEVLGAQINLGSEGTYVIKGGLSPLSDKLDIGESGLATRMFTPIAALCSQPITICGHGSIVKRPLGMMIDPLRVLGVEVRSGGKGFLPITVCGPIRGGEVRVDGSVSSQFITGLLMALPLAEGDTVLRVDRPTSIPYLSMTIGLLTSFGVNVACNEAYTEFFIEGGQRYEPTIYNIEGDWSGASCMLVAGAVAGDVTMRNLNPLSIQADVAIIDALSHAGAEIISTSDSVRVRRRELHGFEFDATHCPDLFPALVALAANCNGESVIRGTNRLLHKESNRALTLAEEFGKMGIEVDISQEDTMRVTGGAIHAACVSSHNDHRIAMATAVAGLCACGDIVIDGAESVDKSYPKFWYDLESLRS